MKGAYPIRTSEPLLNVRLSRENLLAGVIILISLTLEGRSTALGIIVANTYWTSKFGDFISLLFSSYIIKP